MCVRCFLNFLTKSLCPSKHPKKYDNDTTAAKISTPIIFDLFNKYYLFFLTSFHSSQNPMATNIFIPMDMTIS